MKFTLTTAALVLSLLGSGEAARIEIDKTTGPGLIPVYSSAYYGDDGKEYMLGAFDDGFKKTNYSWIRQICLDSGKERGHIVYSGGTKKCFRMTKQSSKLCGGSESCWGGVCNRCWHYVYTEAKCTW